MSLAPPPRKYAAADLLSMPEGDRYELVDGELVEIEMRAESSWIAGEIYRRIANWATGYVPVAPDLAVEVVSPHDLYYDVEEKVLEYLRAGVRLVWGVTPSTRTVMVHRAASTSPLHLTEDAELAGDPVLPGFHCRVVDLFPPRTAAASR